MTVYFSDLDDFGKGVDVKTILAKYRLYFEGKFTVGQIIGAIHKHCERKTAVPKVADINAILSPEPEKISTAEFIHAKEQWKAEGYPAFSYYSQIVKDYEKENAEDRAPLYDEPIHPALKARVQKALTERSN